MNPIVYLRERVLTPLGLTVLAGAIIVTIVINLSRVLLAVGGGTGIYVSCGIAVAILLTAIWAATRPKLPAYSGMFLLAFAGIGSLIAGSISFNRSQAHGEGAAAIPYASEQMLVAQPGGGPIVYDKSELSAVVNPEAAPGIRIDMTSDAGDHTFLIEGRESEFKLAANPSSPASGTLVLPAGQFTYYCDVPGHRAAGMFGTITVTEDPAAPAIGGTAEGEGGEGGGGGEGAH
jgi:plastocyanin